MLVLLLHMLIGLGGHLSQLLVGFLGFNAKRNICGRLVDEGFGDGRDGRARRLELDGGRG